MGENFFMMKAHTYDPSKHFSRSDFWSIKMDGMRTLWDGGVTRGRTDVPWAKGEEATGLWTNNGKIIHAADFFLDRLPKAFIDGELWAGVGCFQKVVSICKRHNAGTEWEQIHLAGYDLPSPSRVMQPRRIDQRHCKINITMAASQYYQRLCDENGIRWYTREGWRPDQLDHLETTYHKPVAHILVPGWVPMDREVYLAKLLDDLVERGHEGIMLRRLGSFWVPVRSHEIVKLKPFIDDEATVIGFVTGADTDKGGRLRGMVGSLICKWNGKTIKVSGLSDDLRGIAARTVEVQENIDVSLAVQWVYDHPGVDVTDGTMYPHAFPIGTEITFRYRETTDDGLPKDARFQRYYEEV